MDENTEDTDRILGITRCAQCGQRLDGEVECPFCAAMRGMDGASARPRHALPLWIYLTALMMTFPLSLPWMVKSDRIKPVLKLITILLGFGWVILWGNWFI